MSWEAYGVLVIIGSMLYGLLRALASPELILTGGLTVMMILSVFSEKMPSPTQLVAGFGNDGLLTVAALFVVVCGLTQTGAMTLFSEKLLGRPKTLSQAMRRLTLPTAILSGFLNNTPIVAAFMPVVSGWCRKMQMPPSKLFIPLSFATILGGACTLIGTSTNLILNSKLAEYSADGTGLGLIEIAKVGLPVVVVGLGYLWLLGPKLLPTRQDVLNVEGDARQYTVEMIVDPQGHMVGLTVEQAGLRHLPGLYLIEIERGEQVLPAVGPSRHLEAGDRLVFVGVVESVVDLRQMRGLLSATDQVYKLGAHKLQRVLVEAVVSPACPLAGKTIREGGFRTHYGAAVIAVARSGERIAGKVGDIRLQPGDNLLLEASPSFASRQRNNSDFYLVSGVDHFIPVVHEKAKVALAVLIGMVVLMVALFAMGHTSPLAAVMVAAGAMILTRCCSAPVARRSIDWSVLIVIGSALGIGEAVKASGLAQVIAGNLITWAQGSPIGTLAVLYLMTNLLTAFITNNAAAVLMFPIAATACLELGQTLGHEVSMVPFVVALMFAASCDFSTPIGYQTNLMVYGPGGYRFMDYVKFGLPLNLLVMLVVLLVLPVMFPF